MVLYMVLIVLAVLTSLSMIPELSWITLAREAMSLMIQEALLIIWNEL